jgi:hypothetical protein
VVVARDDKDVRDYVAYCGSCQQVKASNQLPAFLSPLANPNLEMAKYFNEFHYGHSL